MGIRKVKTWIRDKDNQAIAIGIAGVIGVGLFMVFFAFPQWLTPPGAQPVPLWYRLLAMCIAEMVIIPWVVRDEITSRRVREECNLERQQMCSSPPAP